MIKKLLLPTLLLSIPFAGSALPVLTVGVPANSYLSTPSTVSPSFGSLINFDALTPNTALSATQFVSQGVASISSPDGLMVLPYSTQSAPNEVFDNSSNGTANISVRLTAGAATVGVGVADSDPVTISLQALNSAGTALGSAFSINIASTGAANNPGNGYYLLTDTSSDIYGFLLTQTSASANYSGLAIDDVQFSAGQVAPEPGTSALMGLGVVALALGLRRKRA